MDGKNTRRDELKRTEWLHIRLTPEEAKKIGEKYRKTTYRDLSTYLRKLILEKPITTVSRNKSFDEFIEEMVLLKNELSAIGNNLNQIAKKINSYAAAPGTKLMMEGYRLVKTDVEAKIGEIKNKLNQISDKWLQGSQADGASGER